MLFCQIDFYVFKRDAQISVLKLFLVLYIIQKDVPQSNAKECYVFSNLKTPYSQIFLSGRQRRGWFRLGS